MSRSRRPITEVEKCPHCGAEPPNDRMATHICEHHRDVVNARLQEEVRELREGRRKIEAKLSALEDEPDTDSPGVDPEGPVSYDDAPRKLPGQRVGPSYVNPRECNDCGSRVDQTYSRVYSHEDGTIHCRTCRPRGQRFTNDPLIKRSDDE